MQINNNSFNVNFSRSNLNKFILSRDEKTKNLSAIILTFLALSFFGLFAINPTISTIVQLKKEIADNQEVNQKLEEKITNLSTLQQKYNLLQNDIPFIFSAIPQNPQGP